MKNWLLALLFILMLFVFPMHALADTTADVTITASGIAVPTVTTNAATGVTDNDATLNGNITEDGGTTCNVTFYWDVIDHGATDNWLNSANQTGQVAGAISHAITDNLTASTLYYFITKVINPAGIGWGSTANFTTSATPSGATVTNSSADIDSTTATLNGDITATGNGNCTSRGFVWDTVTRADPGDTAPGASAYSDYWSEAGSFSTGAFEHDAIGLTELTTYFFRACALSSSGAWSYSGELSFFIREDGKVYLELRPDLDESTANVTPTTVHFPSGGVFFGYSRAVWNAGGNVTEELCYQILVPERYNGENDIIVQVTSALSDAGESSNAYHLDLSWEKVTLNEEVVPASFHSVSVLRSNLSALQYYCYRDWYVVDYDAPADDPVTAGDIMALRFRRSSVVPYKFTDLDGELIIMHVAVLFPRGDLLGDPPDLDDYVTEEDMEEIGTQLGVFNVILGSWSGYFLVGIGLMFVLGISWMAFRVKDQFLYIVSAFVISFIAFSWLGDYFVLLVAVYGLGLYLLFTGVTTALAGDSGRGADWFKSMAGKIKGMITK